MGRKALRRSKPQFKKVDFRPITPKLKGFFFNLERELGKRAEQAASTSQAQALVFLRVSCLAVSNYFQTACWLASDKDETGKRPRWAMLAIPSIARTMLDCLFTLVYMLEDLDQRSDLYHRSSYRETAEELQLYQQFHGLKPDYREYINKQKQALKLTAPIHGLSSQEVSDPQHLDYWPTPTQIVKGKLAKRGNRRFLRWLNDWSYRDVSQVAHQSSLGVLKTAMFLLEDTFPDKEDLIDDVGMRFKSMHLAIATVALLSFGSELNSHFGLGHDSDLRYIWGLLLGGIVWADEAWEMRYSKLLH